MSSTFVKIKENLECNVGRDLILREDIGRNKIVEHRGKLLNTYPAVFVVEVETDKAGKERLSYNYKDVLTDNVQVIFTE